MDDDIKQLTELNQRFIEAFRQGSWAMLQPILTPNFRYLNGKTGEVQPQQEYIDNLDGHPTPALDFDQVAIHVDGDTATVSARTFSRPEKFSRFVDTYRREPDGWRCMHACVWPLF